MTHGTNDDPHIAVEVVDSDRMSVLGKATSLLGIRPVASLLVAAAAGYLIGRLQDEPK
jgi:hypothetical protein